MGENGGKKQASEMSHMVGSTSVERERLPGQHHWMVRARLLSNGGKLAAKRKTMAADVRRCNVGRHPIAIVTQRCRTSHGFTAFRNISLGGIVPVQPLAYSCLTDVKSSAASCYKKRSSVETDFTHISSSLTSSPTPTARNPDDERCRKHDHRRQRLVARRLRGPRVLSDERQRQEVSSVQ